MRKLFVIPALLLVAAHAQEVIKVRIVNKTGLTMDRISLANPSDIQERASLTFTGLVAGARSEYKAVTNFFYPCSVWTMEPSHYQRNNRLIHDPDSKVLPRGDYTFEISLSSNEVRVTIEDRKGAQP
jgi:hypothetical protein